MKERVGSEGGEGGEVEIQTTNKRKTGKEKRITRQKKKNSPSWGAVETSRNPKETKINLQPIWEDDEKRTWNVRIPEWVISPLFFLGWFAIPKYGTKFLIYKSLVVFILLLENGDDSLVKFKWRKVGSYYGRLESCRKSLLKLRKRNLNFSDSL